MKENEMEIGLTSKLLSLIEAYPDEYDQHKIATRIFAYMGVIENVRRIDSSKHALLNFVYTIIDKWMEKTAATQSLSCRKGCAFCCKMNVDVTPLEVDLIIDYCKEQKILIDKEYLQQQSVIPKQDIGFTPGLSTCIFLSKENTCTIYPVRPLACRKYVVITPPEICDMPNYPDAKIGVWTSLDAEILTSALDSLQHGLIDSLPKMLLQQLSERP
jgi:Fe-S-cluster containining protein